MKMNHTISLAVVASLLGTTPGYAFTTKKRDVKNDMTINYKLRPKAVDSFDAMFSEGVLYGRLRSNMFYWGWENEQPGNTADNFAWGVGGSVIYSTAYLSGFGATAGVYSTHTIATDNMTTSDGNTFDAGKAGKDTYSRADGSGAPIDVLALAYLEYTFAKNTVRAGRQIFESAMLRSNDTKMIPNTFEGYAIETKEIRDTKLRAAYFTRQKLRDHRDFHSIIAFDGILENDDVAVHRGLSKANILAKGEDVEPGMMVATVENTSIKGLTLNLDGMYIDGFVSSLIAEVNYTIDLGDGLSVTPGGRYIYQMDEGAGAIGGAALSGKADLGGYSDADSVDASAWMARIKLAKGAADLMLGYSAIADDADIIAPWRGFPTGGYTRSMAQYNWEANTRSWMIKAGYDLGKAGVLAGVRGAIDYASMDYDDAKLSAGSIDKTDRNIIHLDVAKTFVSAPNLELKVRMAMINADAGILAVDYQSYGDYRFEVNYLF